MCTLYFAAYMSSSQLNALTSVTTYVIRTSKVLILNGFKSQEKIFIDLKPRKSSFKIDDFFYVRFWQPFIGNMASGNWHLAFLVFLEVLDVVHFM